MERKFTVVGIISSANRNGNTACLVREVLEGAREHGAEVKEIFLADHQLGFCTGCLRCTAQGSCPLPDDLESLRKMVYEADGLVIGSPTYAASYNANLKNFFERLGMFTLFTSSFGGKYAACVSTANGKDAAKTAKQIAGAFKLGFFQRAYLSGTLGVGIMKKGVQTKAQDNPEALRQARALGSKLAEDIAGKKRYPLQNLPLRILTRLNMRPMMIRYIMANKDGREKATYENLRSRGLI